MFSPLHGTGYNTVGRCLQAMGFAEGKHLFTVASQREFRGDFANVKFRTPNPEVPESLEARECRGSAARRGSGAGNRPRRGPHWRLGAVEGGFAFITGNEFAALVTRYRLESLQRAGKLTPASPLVIKTQVTTELMARIAESFGAAVIGDLLVGFKYIGNIIDHLERDRPVQRR